MSFARVRALAIVGVLVTCAAVLVAVTLFKDRQTGVVEDECAGMVIVDVTVPEPKDVKINLYNATGSTSTGYNVAQELSHRGFQVTRQDTDETSDLVAELRYGPETLGGAWLLRAYFLDTAETSFDIDRTDDVVDVVLGSSFRKLATTTEVGQGLAQLGRPTLPAGTCEG